MKLTIAIPTYNRKEQLKYTLNKLVPQLNSDCLLIIIDNNSDIAVESYAIEIFKEYSFSQYEIKRNKINVGGDSNILRCFEYSDSEWLWTLSDDDEIYDNAIAIIMSSIDEFSEAISVNFYSPHVTHPLRHETKKIYGKNEFINNIDSWGASIFLSTNIYNRKKLKNFSKVFCNPYSCCTQWLIIYYSTEYDSLNVISDKIICKNIFNSSEYSSQIIDIVNGFITLLDIPNSKKNRNELILKIATIEKNWIQFQSLIKILLIEYIRSKKSIDILFPLKKYYKFLYKHTTKKNAILFYFYYFLINISPTIAFNLTRKIIFHRSKIDIAKYTLI
jgi:glycosyltransferase involved in cell wall biosynthesis